MGNKNSMASYKSSNAKNTEQASGISKGTNVSHQANTKPAQNLHLIWLDSISNEKNSADCRNTITRLRHVVSTIHTFADGNECIKFIESLNTEKTCIIMSGSLGEHIVPRMHDMSQVDSIFIFCQNKKRHERWAKNWSKIQGVFTEITPICTAVKQRAQQSENDAISISFVPTDSNMSNKRLEDIDRSFMYTQTVKDILVTSKFEEKHVSDFTKYCLNTYADNENELKNVQKFERKYLDKTPIWWYTYECFLYPMLNRALRLMEVEIIMKMGFFINDLYRHVEQLHEKQFNRQNTNETFTVYRGQGMSKKDFDQMTKTEDGLISFNNFLSTSKDRDVSLQFARKALNNPDMVGILFVMTIDPSVSTVPFASVNGVSYFKGEDEVLFAMHTVFRIHDIKSMGDNDRFFQVNLTLTSDNDKDLHALNERIRGGTEGSAGWGKLGGLLLKMGDVEKAQQVFKLMLDQTTDESEKAKINDQLQKPKSKPEEYKEINKFYEKSVQISQETHPPYRSYLTTRYHHMDSTYDKVGEYSKECSSHEKIVEIRQQPIPGYYPSFTMNTNNMGFMHGNIGHFPNAQSYHEKIVETQQQPHPANHFNLGTFDNNIDYLYDNVTQYRK